MNPTTSLLRTLPRCPKIRLNLVQSRNSFYNKYRHGPQAISNPEPDYKQWVKDFFGPEGKEFIKTEAIRLANKPFRNHMPKHIKLNKTDIFEHFDTNEAIRRWKPVSDSDSLNGFSTSSFVKSPNGHGLFKGVLDTRLPNDGLTMYSGFAAVVGPGKQPDSPLMGLGTYWNWTGYNCLEIKYRGDGRKYAIVINTASWDNDLQYYDAHSFPLYTRGGPYWETFRVPFSRFIFNYKGLIQDEQGGLPYFRVKFVALTIQDKIDGPFSLEVDYIGLRHETRPFYEISPYEEYTFNHIKYRPLQVDCEAPESS